MRCRLVSYFLRGDPGIRPAMNRTRQLLQERLASEDAMSGGSDGSNSDSETETEAEGGDAEGEGVASGVEADDVGADVCTDDDGEGEGRTPPGTKLSISATAGLVRAGIAATPPPAIPSGPAAPSPRSPIPGGLAASAATPPLPRSNGPTLVSRGSSDSLSSLRSGSGGGGAAAGSASTLCIKNGSIVDPHGIIAMAMLSVSPIAVPLSGPPSDSGGGSGGAAAPVSIRSTVGDIPARLLLAAINVSIVGLLEERVPVQEQERRPEGAGEEGGDVMRLDGQDLMGDVQGGKLRRMCRFRLPGSSGTAREFSVDCDSSFELEPCVGLAIVRDVGVYAPTEAGDAFAALFLSTPVSEYLTGCDGQTKQRCFGSPVETAAVAPKDARKARSAAAVLATPAPVCRSNLVVMKGNVPVPTAMLFATDLPGCVSVENAVECSSSGAGAYMSSECYGEGTSAMKHRNNVKRRRQG